MPKRERNESTPISTNQAPLTSRRIITEMKTAKGDRPGGSPKCAGGVQAPRDGSFALRDNVGRRFEKHRSHRSSDDDQTPAPSRRGGRNACGGKIGFWKLAPSRIDFGWSRAEEEGTTTPPRAAIPSAERFEVEGNAKRADLLGRLGGTRGGGAGGGPPVGLS